jgi:hypothetical protein
VLHYPDGHDPDMENVVVSGRVGRSGHSGEVLNEAMVHRLVHVLGAVKQLTSHASPPVTFPSRCTESMGSPRVL